LRTAEERAGAVRGRAEGLLRAAQEERDARRRAQERRERMERQARAGRAVGTAVDQVLARLERSVEEAAAARTAVEESRREREHELRETRAGLRDLQREHDELVNTVHRDEMARAQQRMRIEQLQERSIEELGMDPDGL